MHVDLRAVGAVVVPVGLAFVVITIVVVVIAVMISLTTVTTWLPASGKSRVFRIHCEMQRILEIKRVSPTPKSLCQALFGIQKQGARVISFGCHRSVVEEEKKTCVRLLRWCGSLPVEFSRSCT